MRKSGRWMTIWDDRILEYIRETGSGTPTELAESGYVRVSRQHVSRRLRKLADHDLLRSLGNGVYVITDAGEAYLEGDIDTASPETTQPAGEEDVSQEP